MNFMGQPIGAKGEFRFKRASGGTALTLPILMALGFPGHMANASNRIGLLVSAITRVAIAACRH